MKRTYRGYRIEVTSEITNMGYRAVDCKVTRLADGMVIEEGMTGSFYGHGVVSHVMDRKLDEIDELLSQKEKEA